MNFTDWLKLQNSRDDSVGKLSRYCLDQIKLSKTSPYSGGWPEKALSITRFTESLKYHNAPQWVHTSFKEAWKEYKTIEYQAEMKRLNL